MGCDARTSTPPPAFPIPPPTPSIPQNPDGYTHGPTIHGRHHRLLHGDSRWHRYSCAVLEHLIAVHIKISQNCIPKRSRNRHIRSISPSRHQNSSHPRLIVPRIHRHPASVKKHLIPRAEIARPAVRPANIPQIPRHIPCRNILATRQRNRQMLIVPAHSQSAPQKHPSLSW